MTWYEQLPHCKTNTDARPFIDSLSPDGQWVVTYWEGRQNIDEIGWNDAYVTSWSLKEDEPLDVWLDWFQTIGSCANVLDGPTRTVDLACIDAQHERSVSHERNGLLFKGPMRPSVRGDVYGITTSIERSDVLVVWCKGGWEAYVVTYDRSRMDALLDAYASDTYSYQVFLEIDDFVYITGDGTFIRDKEGDD